MNLINKLFARQPKVVVEVIHGDFDPTQDHIVADMILSGTSDVVIPVRALYNIKINGQTRIDANRKNAGDLMRRVNKILAEEHLLTMLEYRCPRGKLSHTFDLSVWDFKAAQTRDEVAKNPRIEHYQATPTA